jgi:hypothetical protein
MLAMNLSQRMIVTFLYRTVTNGDGIVESRLVGSF